jgi:hypothetical protein
MSRHALLSLLVLASPVAAEVHHHDENCEHGHANEKSEGMRFAPHVSASMALGGSTGDDHFFEDAGHHDPRADGWNMQALEVGGAVHVGDDFSIVAIYNEQWDRHTQWNGHWEEAFIKFRMTPRVLIKTGIYMPEVGLQNHLHLHARSFVESNLMNTRFLGEDGLIMEGFSLGYEFGSEQQHVLTIGVGSAYEFAHEHEHEEEEEEPLIHAEEGFAVRNIVHGRFATEIGGAQWGVSGMHGENHFGRNTFVVGADVSRDVTLGGKDASFSAEVNYRKVEGVEEDSGDDHNFHETAVALAMGYSLTEELSSNSRAEWISGSDAAGLDERVRLSTNLSYQHELLEQLDGMARLQYNADFLPGGESESTVWLQYVIEFGL